MSEPIDYPWFHSTVSLLDLRQKDRVLVVGAGSVTHVEAVVNLIGSRGSVTVIEPMRSLAEAIARVDHPGMEVLALAPAGSERFGAFDALLSCPLGLPDWPVSNYAGILRSNLRPGGRFVLDLPAPATSPDLVAAYADCGGDAGDLSPLCGPDAAELAELLQREGLRSVHAALGSHLLELHSPHDLVAMFAPVLPAAHDRLTELGLALAHQLHGTANVQTLVHRTRVHGQR